MASLYSNYLTQRYKSYVEQRRKLDSNAISIAEKYDQWILTISGGALALSLTFIEKIAKNPLIDSLPIIVFAWLFFVISLLSGLLAIRYSSIGLVRQIEILDAEYQHFLDTSSENNLQGERLPPIISPYPRWIKIASKTSLISLIAGSVFLCTFSVINLYGVPSDDNLVKKNELMSQSTIKNKSQQGDMKMSDTKKPLQDTIKKSYIPPSSEKQPPAPIKPPLTETYIPPVNEVPPPPPQNNKK